jgi:inhibitor of the pro-sigma K processing machinery
MFENATTLPFAFDTGSIFTLIVGLALVIVAAYVVYKVLKSLVINAIAGGIGLLALHFLGPLVGFTMPITVNTILVCVIAGLPGLVIAVVLKLLGVTL